MPIARDRFTLVVPVSFRVGRRIRCTDLREVVRVRSLGRVPFAVVPRQTDPSFRSRPPDDPLKTEETYAVR